MSRNEEIETKEQQQIKELREEARDSLLGEECGLMDSAVLMGDFCEKGHFIVFIY